MRDFCERKNSEIIGGDLITRVSLADDGLADPYSHGSESLYALSKK